MYALVSSVLVYRRLMHIPGPLLASISYLYIFRVWLSRRQSLLYGDLNKQYNSRIVRIGPSDLITDDPDFIKRMNSARSKYGRSSWYSATKVNPYGASLVNMLDVKEHDKLKSKMSFGYGGKENPELEAGIDEQVEALVDLIRRKYVSFGSGLKPLDVARIAQYFTLDSITRIAYGREFGYLATEEDVFGYIRATETGKHCAFSSYHENRGTRNTLSLLTRVMFRVPVVPLLVICGEIP